MHISNEEIIMGTDDKREMTNALDQAFPGIKRKLCCRHLKENIIRQTTNIIPKSTKELNDIVNLIFGKGGIALADDSAIFDGKNSGFKDSLITNGHADFLNYYDKHVEAKLLYHVITKFDKMRTNDNTESMNNRLKGLL
ncbi:hypothetical protein DPMN_175796 [Dreissena polymorpha]|uniref:Uncharacterized protein n=1 Tax=Dreissena polymorpha TaxID=45954 RepID=A0A9D4E5T1_DREPO|nr:hypothetical protein DPMN_175796 [Dreissena polymorpha]